MRARRLRPETVVLKIIDYDLSTSIIDDRESMLDVRMIVCVTMASVRQWFTTTNIVDYR